MEYSVDTLLRTPGITSITVALRPDDTFAADLQILTDPRVSRVAGGDERADSVLAALYAVAGEQGDWVLVHDAARPGLRIADVQRLIAAVIAKGEGGILAEPVVDTIKLGDAVGRVEKTLDRSALWRAHDTANVSVGGVDLRFGGGEPAWACSHRRSVCYGTRRPAGTAGVRLSCKLESHSA